MLGQAGCNVVVVDINVDAHIDANIAHLVWLKLWAMFTLLPIYLPGPIGFVLIFTQLCLPLKEKYSTQKICHAMIFSFMVQNVESPHFESLPVFGHGLITLGLQEPLYEFYALVKQA